MKSFWHLIIQVELSSLKFSFFTFSMYSSSSSFRNDDFSSSSNGDEDIFNDMERGPNDFSIQFTLVTANFLELFNAKYIAYKL